MQSSVLFFFAQTAILLPAFLLALSFHEFMHAFVAFLCGDKTAQRMGRLTLNPLAHVDFIGLLFLFLFRIGWAKPVPFNNQNFKYPKLFSILTALAGPFANFFLAIIIFYLEKYIPFHIFHKAIALTFIQILETTAYVNIMLGVFNLIPIPPLDGSHVFTMLLIDKFPGLIHWLYRYSFFILFFLIFFPTTRFLLITLINFTEKLLYFFVI